MSSPEEELAHGRAWTYAELSYKSFNDLHGLYWVCVKEKNRIATAAKERDRVFAGYGDYESQSRNREVSRAICIFCICCICLLAGFGAWGGHSVAECKEGANLKGKERHEHDENSFHSPI